MDIIIKDQVITSRVHKVPILHPEDHKESIARCQLAAREKSIHQIQVPALYQREYITRYNSKALHEPSPGLKQLLPTRNHDQLLWSPLQAGQSTEL